MGGYSPDLVTSDQEDRVNKFMVLSIVMAMRLHNEPSLRDVWGPVIVPEEQEYLRSVGILIEED